jgi:hypothetical protein
MESSQKIWLRFEEIARPLEKYGGWVGESTDRDDGHQADEPESKIVPSRSKKRQ